MTTLDTGFHARYLNENLQDPEFRREYEIAQKQIAQVDAVVRALDELRIQTGLSKAELARRIGKHPAAIRRLFSAEANPELGTIAALAIALGAEIRIVPSAAPSPTPQKRTARHTSSVA
jgi:ribosome-binding protein aMBF1 (putative translation factor)